MVEHDLKKLGIEKNTRLAMVKFGFGSHITEVLLETLNKEYSINTFLRFVDLNKKRI